MITKSKEEKEAELQSEASFDIMWAHKPRLEPTDYTCLLDCDPRMGDVTQEEFNTAVKDCRVWTEVGGDEYDYPHVIPGYHLVNRLRHFITEMPYFLSDVKQLTVDITRFPELWVDKWIQECMKETLMEREYLLGQCLNALNQIPNSTLRGDFSKTYDLAAELARHGVRVENKQN